ncbi:MAG: hypothetical protein RLZZ244_295 [Verrucomicrobiota bacterium]
MSEHHPPREPSLPDPCNQPLPNRWQRFLYWLAGADWETLQLCPAGERERVAVLGSTVLVPTVMAFLGMFFFAKSRSADPSFFAVLVVSLLWAFVILNTDRTLIALYRPFQPFWRRAVQVAFRLGLAGVVSLVISFPFCLDQYRPAIRHRFQTELQGTLNQLRQTESAGSKVLRERLESIRESSETERRKLEADYAKLREGLVAQLEAQERTQLNPELYADEKMEEERRRVTAADFVAPASGTTLNGIARNDALKEAVERMSKQLEEQQSMHRRLVEAIAREELGLPNEFYPEPKKPGEGPRLKDMRLRDAKVASDIRRLEAGLHSTMADLAAGEEAVAKAHLTDRNAYLDSLTAKRNSYVEEARERDNLRRERLKKLNTQIADAAEEHVQIMRKFQAHTQAVEEEHARAKQRHDETYLPPITRLEQKISGIFDPMEETIGLYKVIFTPPPDMPADAKLPYRWAAGLFQFLVVFGTLFLLDLIPIVVKLLSRAGPYDVLVEHSEFIANINLHAFREHFQKHGTRWPGPASPDPASASGLLRPYYAPPPSEPAHTPLRREPEQGVPS